MKRKKEHVKKRHIRKTNCVAESIPYESVYANGIIEVWPRHFSKSYWIPETNFKTLNDEEQWRMGETYAAFLSSFDAGTDIEITLYNRTIDLEKFREQVLIPVRPDKFNHYREKYNEMLSGKMAGAKNNLQTEKICTVTVEAVDIISANEKFAQIDTVVEENMTLMTRYAAQPMSLVERLEILNKIYNQENARPLYEQRMVNGHLSETFSLENCVAQGITTKEVIAPSSFDFKDSCPMIGESLVKSYFICTYPTWIRGTLLTDFADIPTNLLVSVHFHPMDQKSSIKMVTNKGVNISASIVEAQKRAAKSGYDTSLISPALMASKAETTGLLEDMTKNNSKLFTVNFIITLFAESAAAMSGFEEQLKLIANKNLVTVKPLAFQQEDAFNSALPLGYCHIYADRLMTSQSVASIIPFNVQEVRQMGGRYYGQNAISHTMILYDRTEAVNPNACILGMPGAGKSFSAKREMIDVLLSLDDEVYAIDPEAEYSVLADAFGGSVIKIANGSHVYINPFNLNIANTDDTGDPVKVKTDFIETVCEIMLGGKYGLSPIEKSIIDRSVMEIYQPYLKYLQRTGKNQDTRYAPTFLDFYNSLCAQMQIEAQNLALSLERYVKGALDVFSHATNVDIQNKFNVYDISHIGSGLKELGLHICLDNIGNKMIDNFAKSKRTWIYIDEFHLAMQKPTSAAYISQIWKRARKWNGIPCAITQNVEDMLKNEDARTVINNSSFVIMLGQSPINKQQLAQIYNLSPVEQKYISSAKPGMGLIRIGENIIPMDDTFPKNNELYSFMTTKAGERIRR